MKDFEYKLTLDELKKGKYALAYDENGYFLLFNGKRIEGLKFFSVRGKAHIQYGNWVVGPFAKYGLKEVHPNDQAVWGKKEVDPVTGITTITTKRFTGEIVVTKLDKDGKLI